MLVHWEKMWLFISRDAGRCKAAASLPGSSGGEERLCLPSYKPATWSLCYYFPLHCVDGRIWDSKAHNECWVMTQVRRNEFHLIFLRKMWLDRNKCGSLSLCCTICVSKVLSSLLLSFWVLFKLIKNIQRISVKLVRFGAKLGQIFLYCLVES